MEITISLPIDWQTLLQSTTPNSESTNIHITLIKSTLVHEEKPTSICTDEETPNDMLVDMLLEN